MREAGRCGRERRLDEAEEAGKRVDAEVVEPPDEEDVVDERPVGHRHTTRPRKGDVKQEPLDHVSECKHWSRRSEKVWKLKSATQMLRSWISSCLHPVEEMIR